MTLGQNPFNPSRSLPTLAAINRRRTELNAYQVRQEAANQLPQLTSFPPSTRHTFQKNPVLSTTKEEPQDLQHPYPGDAYPNEYPEPSAAPSAGSSAPPPPH